uniref:Sushi, von Willebrand factor type A, EGF and pentraxin domain-containing protein 1 n=1 Tax=Phallusia mammillata TaxID=59560 RepID=A0A6F9DTF4_9ASCI|nr:sushi, von Willebrand factor type A, EGF and pentraxin domain-containing protein 1 [Phallusia mammillata]
MFTCTYKWSSTLVILFLMFSVFSNVKTDAASSNCQPRDLSLVEAGRSCKKSCATNADCSAANKDCHCDGPCGLSCFNMNLNCPVPVNISNGILSYTSTQYGSKAKYTCNNGFLGVNGSAKVTCRSDKKWSGSPLVCERACGKISNVGVAYLNPAKYEDTNLEGYRVGYVMPYKCRTGHQMIGSPPSRTCLDSGQWSVAQFSCSKRSCSRPRDPDNGYHNGTDYTFASFVDYGCNKGYTVVERTTRAFCEENQETMAMGWDQNPPTCEVVRCPAPGVPANGDIATKGVDYTYGTTITYTCNKGYLFVDPTSIKRTCNATGQWGSVPECIVSYDCTFEVYKTSFCSYTSSKWLRRSMKDHTGRTRYGLVSNAEATLTSPTFPNSTKTYEITFYYKSTDNVNLALILQPTDGSAEQTLWNTASAQNSWKKVSVLLKPQSVNVTWTVKRSGPSTASSYIDDITIQTPPAISTTTTIAATTTTLPSPTASTTASTVAPPTTTTATTKSTTKKPGIFCCFFYCRLNPFVCIVVQFICR